MEDRNLGRSSNPDWLKNMNFRVKTTRCIKKDFLLILEASKIKLLVMPSYARGISHMIHCNTGKGICQYNSSLTNILQFQVNDGITCSASAAT